MTVFTVTALCPQAFYADIQIAAPTCSENPNVHRPYLRGSPECGWKRGGSETNTKNAGKGRAVRSLLLLFRCAKINRSRCWICGPSQHCACRQTANLARREKRA